MRRPNRDIPSDSHRLAENRVARFFFRRVNNGRRGRHAIAARRILDFWSS